MDQSGRIAVEWGTVGEWAGAAGGVLAVIAVLVVARIEHRARVEERKLRVEAEREAALQRALALQVVFRVRDRGDDPDRWTRWEFEVQNTSPEPFYEGCLVFADAVSDDRRHSLSTIHARRASHTSVRLPYRDDKGCRPPFTVEFSDYKGQRWPRDQDGRVSAC